MEHKIIAAFLSSHFFMWWITVTKHKRIEASNLSIWTSKSHKMRRVGKILKNPWIALIFPNTDVWLILDGRNGACYQLNRLNCISPQFKQ